MTIGLTAANAGKALLVDQSATLTIVSNFAAEIENPDAADGSANERDIPCVVCFSDNITEAVHGTLISNLNLHFRIIASQDDTDAAGFDALYSQVHGVINTASICSNLSAVQDDFYCFGFWGEIQETDLRIEGRHFVKEIILPITCCPYDLS